MSRPALVSREAFADMVGRAGPDSPLRQLRAPRGRRASPEHDGQAEYFRSVVPDLKRLYPVSAHLFDLTYANPQQGQQGRGRGKMWGVYFAAEGKKPGVPDLTHPVARFGYHGLYVENKIGRTPLSDEQMDWACLLQRQGFAAVVCRAVTPDALAEAIGKAVGRYTMFDPNWHDHIDPREAWL
jgi:hypothetical protein